MKRRSFLLSMGSALALSACVVVPATQVRYSEEAIEVDSAPPPVRHEPLPPPRGIAWVWVPGRWVWRGGAWVWFGGRYVQRPRRSARWVVGYWRRGARGWVWVPGHWG